MRFDDIEIVQAIDRHEDASNGAPLWSLNGLRLVEELAGGLVADQTVHSGFVKELHTLRDCALLTFKTYSTSTGELPNPDQNAHYYLQQVHSFALTPQGRDRARGRMIVQPVPDSSEDDGRLIPHSVIASVADAVEAAYPPAQQAAFLRECSVPVEGVLPLPDEPYVQKVLNALRGSEGRRILRTFLGSWLSDGLATGPTGEQGPQLVRQLARHGWFVKGDRLVVGEPERGGPAAIGGNRKRVQQWRPLSHRAGGTLDEPLIEDIPDWLYRRLQGWMYLVLQDDFGPVKVIRPGSEALNTEAVMLRLRTTVQPWLIPADDPAFIDAIDASLYWVSLNPGRRGIDNLELLEDILSVANSIWRSNVEDRRLERRVDTTVTAAVMTARKSANAEAADHLDVAWAAAYGRHPDPDKAYDEAVLAVEALACPLVSPRNLVPTLGTVIRDLKNQAAKWQLTLVDKTGQPASPDGLIGMLEVLWESQSRHAGSSNSRHQTQAEGELAVHLAAMAVQWLTAGALSRRIP